ncbi:MAG: rps8 [Haloplasmataceae bacterium]|jgi:ribosomal protein S8|nr:rps8 [Haloplasmataceae bacterium]
MNNHIFAIINQSIKSRKNILFVPYNKINLVLCSLLYKENLIYSYNINHLSNKIKIHLNKLDNKFPFSGMKIISKPSKRVYITLQHLKRKVIKEGKFFIISTSFGIFTSNEAIKRNLSGEILVEILC